MRQLLSALPKIELQPNPAEFASAFFMPVNTLFFQNLRQEESRKEALHAMIEGIQAYPDRKMEVKFRIGEKVKGTHRDGIPNPISYIFPLRFNRYPLPSQLA